MAIFVLEMCLNINCRYSVGTYENILYSFILFVIFSMLFCQFIMQMEVIIILMSVNLLHKHAKYLNRRQICPKGRRFETFGKLGVVKTVVTQGKYPINVC